MTTRHVQTKREIKTILQGAGLHPRKQLGQHFLIDGNLMRRLVQEAHITGHDLVIEVGGGTGGLTDLLVHQAGHVLCAEIDRELQNILRDRFHHRSNFTLITGDVLEKKHQLHPQLVQAMEQHDTTSENVKLVSNLPYQVATPLVMNLLVDHPRVQRLVFTQAQAAKRHAASAGGENTLRRATQVAREHGGRARRRTVRRSAQRSPHGCREVRSGRRGKAGRGDGAVSLPRVRRGDARRDAVSVLSSPTAVVLSAQRLTPLEPRCRGV